MGIGKIQADYDALARIAREFKVEADTATRLYNHVYFSMQALESGGWIGRGANAFYDEMHHDVLPALDRLIKALEEAGIVVERISTIIQDAEAEAGNIFPHDGGVVPHRPGGARPGAQPRDGRTSPARSSPRDGGTGPGPRTSPAQAGGPVGVGGAAPQVHGVERRTFPTHLLDGTQVQGYGGVRATARADADMRISNPFHSRVDATASLWNDSKTQGLSFWDDGGKVGQWGAVHGSVGTYEVRKGGELSINEIGIKGKASGGAGLYAGKFEAGYQRGGFDAAVEGFIGAEAKGEIGLAVNPLNGDYMVEGKLGGFAGGKAAGEVSHDFGALKVGAQGSLSKGIGIGAEGRFGVDDYVFKADFEIGATAGVGASGGFIVELDLKHAAEDVMHGAQDVIDFLTPGP